MNVQFDPQSVVGIVREDPFWEILATPTWDDQSKRWRALSNCNGELCIVALSLRIEGSRTTAGDDRG